MLISELFLFFDKISLIAGKNNQINEIVLLFEKISYWDAFIVSDILSGKIYDKCIFHYSDKSLLLAISEYYLISLEKVKKELHSLGDLGLVVELFDKNRDKNSSKTSINEFYNFLLKISNISGNDSVAKKKKYIFEMFDIACALEKKYIIKILLGKLRIRISEMAIVSAIQKIAKKNQLNINLIEEAYLISNNLELIIKYIYEKNIQGLIELSSPIIGNPISPASAERLITGKLIFEKLNQLCLLEPKYDGLRLQVHVSQKKGIFLFSRNLKNVTDSFPEIFSEFSILLSQKKIEDAIFDAEILSFDLKINEYKTFQETSQRRRKHNISVEREKNPVHLILFDCLYLNGISLLNVSLIDRLEALKKSIDQNSILKIIESKIIQNFSEIDNLFNFYVNKGYEGVMIKKLDAPYHKGKRTFNWIKLKRTSKSFVSDSIDVVVMGYFYGEGKYQKRAIGSLLVGVLDDQNEMLLTCAKVGIGLSDETWKELHSKLSHLTIQNLLKNMSISNLLIPDVLVFPSIIVSIEGDELTISKEHSSEFSIRFPRLVNIVSDKNIDQITTVAELKAMHIMQKGR